MARKKAAPVRQLRANGEESRRKILEAATEIASERGYEGTSIALVSERSGLPASSIYWHFEDKDRLIAAVIEASFSRWLIAMAAWSPPAAGMSKEDVFKARLRRTGRAFIESNDFLRLGLMLALEKTPAERSARSMFLAVRAQALNGMVASYKETFDDLSDADCRRLARLTMALCDGVFIAHDVDHVDIDDAFDEVVPAAIFGAIEELRMRRARRRRKRA
jgi:AcrR family transcriptional regulator